MPKRKPPARLRYDTDLTDMQWELIAPMIPDARTGGRPRKATSRELVDAILYFLRAGAAWRMLPHDLPPWQTVYYYLRRWQEEGVAAPPSCARSRRPRTMRPGGVSVGGDPRQSVGSHRRSKGGEKGYDAGKKITGRKRHILTDTDGRLLTVRGGSGDLDSGHKWITGTVTALRAVT